MALRRLRRLMLSQCVADRWLTGLLIVTVDVPMYGFTVDMTFCNNVTRFLPRNAL